ncbi:hypothetical protein J0S82_001704 [Galemys pyrenaicus]|uniref:Uncharacterized protein n=1 Tax=Galemys pyrenaicus TaxID=202257 RepID=A0A8J5ZUV0_GALPY|nr:hypothetical protein J0S82_001704 [Galemys pyrenaicus]
MLRRRGRVHEALIGPSPMCGAPLTRRPELVASQMLVIALEHRLSSITGMIHKNKSFLDRCMAKSAASAILHSQKVLMVKRKRMCPHQELLSAALPKQ